MSGSRGDFKPTVTAALTSATAEKQSAIRALKSQLDLGNSALASLGSGPRSGGAIELVCGLTGAALWVCPQPVVGIPNRVMSSPPSPGEPSTRWICLKASDPALLSYRDPLFLWNPARDASMVPTWPHWSIEVKPDPLNGPNSGWLLYRLIDPRDPQRWGPIPDGAAVAIEWLKDEADPIRFLRPIIRDGECFIERSGWETPEHHTFYIRALPDSPAATAVSQDQSLRSGSIIRLRSVETGEVVWVNPPHVAGVPFRPLTTPPFAGTRLLDRFCMMEPGRELGAPLVYGSCVTLRSMDFSSFGNLDLTDWHDGVFVGGFDSDGRRLIRLAHSSERLSGKPITHGSPVVLECVRYCDGARVSWLTLQGNSGFRWLERKVNSTASLFTVELVDSRDARSLAAWQAWTSQLVADLVSRQKELAQSATQGRTDVSMRFDGQTNLGVSQSPALAGLTPPSTLTVEIRAFVDDSPSYWTCLLSKGGGAARDYHLFATGDDRIAFSMNLPDGAAVEVQTPPGVISRRSWHLISCVVDVPRMRITVYVDGKEQARLPLSRQLVVAGRSVALPVAMLRSSTAEPLQFGRAPDSSPPETRLRGYIDEVRIFNAARTAAEITDLLYMYATGGEPGLVSCWRLGEQRQGVVPDITGSGNDAVIGR